MSVNAYLTLPPARGLAISHVWKTSMQKSITGKEKRSALYTWPRLRINYPYKLTSDAKQNWLKRRLFKYAHELWGVPIWPDKTILTAQAASGQKVVNIESSVNRHFYEDRDAILIDPSDYTGYEAVTIDVLAADQITTVSNLANAWPENSWILPLYYFHIPKGPEVIPQYIKYGTFQLEATESFESAPSFSYSLPASGADTYKGYDIFFIRPFKDGRKQPFEHRYSVLQSLGPAYSESTYDETLIPLEMSVRRASRSDLWALQNFFDSKMGRLSPFWVPSWQPDIVVTSAFLSADTILDTENIEYPTYWWPNAVTGKDVIFIWPDESYVCRKITGATTTTITLDSAVGKDCDADTLPYLLTSFLYFVRFDLDELEMVYLTSSVVRAPLSFCATPATYIDYGFGSNGSIYNDDCSDISSWVNADVGTGVSQDGTSPSGDPAFEFDNGSAGSGNRAIRYKDVGSFGTRLVVELKLYHEQLGTYAATDFFQLIFNFSGVRLLVYLASDGLWVHNGSTVTEVGTDLVEIGKTQRWLFDVDASVPASATVDICLAGSLVASGVDCSFVGSYTDGEVLFAQRGDTLANNVSHVENIRIGDDLE